MEVNKKHKRNDSKTITNIIENYLQNEKALVAQLYFKTSNGTTIGGFREDIWKEMFQQIVPRKFTIEQSVFIIDSEGRVSNEVDLAIFDETYTPYIFRYGKLKFIPIEAVAVVVECKSTSLNNNILKNWSESVADLETSLKSYTRLFTQIVVGETNSNMTQTQTRPLRILCCLNENIVNTSLENGEKLFDIIVRAPSEEGLKIEIDENKKNLRDWYLALNHANYKQDTDKKKIDDGTKIKEVPITSYEVKNNDTIVSLLTLNLQLNQILMLINNPILFPHMAYVEMFNKFGNGGKSDE